MYRVDISARYAVSRHAASRALRSGVPAPRCPARSRVAAGSVVTVAPEAIAVDYGRARRATSCTKWTAACAGPSACKPCAPRHIRRSDHPVLVPALVVNSPGGKPAAGPAASPPARPGHSSGFQKTADRCAPPGAHNDPPSCRGHRECPVCRFCSRQDGRAHRVRGSSSAFAAHPQPSPHGRKTEITTSVAGGAQSQQQGLV